jgi:chromosomal replication initiation ATPase DnaA
VSKQIKGIDVGLSNKNLLELLLRVCKAYDVSQKDIQSPSESKILVKTRKAFACSAWTQGVPIHKIGAVLGNRDRSVIASYIRQS